MKACRTQHYKVIKVPTSPILVKRAVLLSRPPLTQEFQGQMKIEKDTIKFFQSLCWDYQVSEENIITIIELGEYNGLTRKNLLSRALKSRRWYEIKKILSPELLKEALSEDVLKTLFPKSLSLK